MCPFEDELQDEETEEMSEGACERRQGDVPLTPFVRGDCDLALFGSVGTLSSASTCSVTQVDLRRR